MVDKKTDNDLYCGFPIASPSKADQLKQALIDHADEGIKNFRNTTDIYVPFVSDAIIDFHMRELDNNPLVQSINEDLNSLIDQAIAYSHRPPPNYLRFVDRNSRQWIGTPIIGEYLCPYYQIDLRERAERHLGHSTFKEVCLDYPGNIMDHQGMFCLFAPWGFVCRNEDIRNYVVNLLFQDQVITRLDVRSEIANDDSRLHKFLVSRDPSSYDAVDWNVNSYRIKIFKFAGGILLERNLRPNEDKSNLDLYPEEVEKTGGNKFRLYEESFSTDAELLLASRLMDAHLRLYHLYYGSSEPKHLPSIGMAFNAA